jgi:3-methyl-2-oxobutanoate hydroxymethyltransferase
MTTITLTTLQKKKQAGEKFSCLTCYEASFAHAMQTAGIDTILVGDSLGMVVQGHSSTLPVSVADMAYHTANVARANTHALIITDLPFMSYATVADAVASSRAVMQAGANVVKIEGGSELAPIVELLSKNGVPVCVHLGLTPQSVNIFGGYKVQGRGDAAQALFDDALALEAAGAQLLVLECVPVELAQRITEALTIPVIGIGAGNVTDGQILVMHDAFGITGGHIPKFAKNFLAEAGDMRAAVRQYIADVESGVYPGEEHSFH